MPDTPTLGQTNDWCIIISIIKLVKSVASPQVAQATNVYGVCIAILSKCMRNLNFSSNVTENIKIHHLPPVSLI